MSALVKFAFLSTVIIFAVGFYFLYSRILFIEKNIPAAADIVSATPEVELTKQEPSSPSANPCDENCRELIKLEVKNAIAGESGTLTPKPVPVPTSQAAKKTQSVTYIPLGGNGPSTSTDWVDVAGSGVYVDMTNDYSAAAYVTWEAQLKIANANGYAFARLFDATHSIAVSGSELSVNTASYTNVGSPRIYLWQGRNLYKVQIKSQTSEAASFGSGRIKVVY